MTYNETEQLIERYLAGETTHEEELQLALEVSHDDVPEEWKLIAEMLGTLTVDEALYDEEMRRRKTVTLDISNQRKRSLRRSLKWMWTAAACMVAIAITVPLVWNRSSDPDVVAYIYGEKVTEPDAVMELMASTMEDMFDQGANDPVAELEGFFGK